MAKQAKKLASFRLPLEIVFSIQEMADVMSTSQSDIVEQAVVLFESRQRGEASIEVRPVLSTSGGGGTASLQAMIDAKQGHKSEVGKFPCRCVHSGCGGAKFAGASKFANICPSCEEGGHRGDRRDCPECWQPA